LCGIFATVGRSNVSNIISEGLKKLEYRGYDSAGICFETKENVFEIIKSSNSNYPVDALIKKLNNQKNSYYAGIGHTRWATHGLVNNTNAHPHLSFSNNLSIVHNGIVENYSFLKKLLIRKNVELKTETDSEVIASLIDMQLSCSENIQSAIFSVFNLIEGINTIAIMHKNYPGKIFGYSTDHSGGLVVGRNQSNNFLSSDVYALENVCNSIYLTNKDELVTISKNSIEIIDKDYKKINPKELPIAKINKKQILEKFNYKTKFIIEKEILEQKEILTNLINQRIIENSKNTFPEIDNKKITNSNKFIFTGMGSSYNSALFGSLMFEEIIEKDCKAEFSSELKRKKIINPEETTLFAISQSGETADTLEAIKNCRLQGVNVITITEHKNSKASIYSDSFIQLGTGKENSVAATKTFSSTLMLLNAIAINFLCIFDMQIGLSRELKKNYEHFHKNILDIFTCCDNNYSKASKLITDSNKVLFVGKHLNYPIVKEASLKFQEIAKINSNAFIEGELKHGPNALLDEFTSVISIIGPEDDVKKSIGSIREIISRGSNVIVISYKAFHEFKDLSDNILIINNKNKYAFSILATIILQKLAFFSSLNLGLDPDRPKNLAKTVTVE
jgi:glucosamine--fructose-6-phosphate aminotransferase (isomerizing)